MHQADHGHIDNGLIGFWQALIILAQAPLSVEPGKSSLDNRVFGQQYHPQGIYHQVPFGIIKVGRVYLSWFGHQASLFDRLLFAYFQTLF